MAFFSLNIDQLETNLIISHRELVRQLEAEYMKRINGLLQQQAVILMDLHFTDTIPQAKTIHQTD